MAKKSGNFVVRLILLVLVAGAIFFALDHFLTPKGKSENAEGAPQTTEAAGTETPPTTPSATSTLTREQAEQIGRDVGTRIGQEVGTQVGQQIAQEMLAQREAEMASKKAAKKPAEAAPPAEAVAAAPTAETTPAAAPAEEPPPPTEAAPVASTETSAAAPEETPAPAPRKKKRREPKTGVIPGMPTVAPASTTWWDKSLSSDKNALVLDFAGGMKGSAGTAVALVFRGRFDSTADIASHVTVKDQGGQPVSGEWKLGARQGMAYLPAQPGQYEVTVGEGLKDAEGHTLGQTLSGSVNVSN